MAEAAHFLQSRSPVPFAGRGGEVIPLHRDTPPVQGGLAPWQVRRVLAYITDHIAEPMPNAVLAATAKLSTHYFPRAFRRSVGVSPHRYVILQRVEHAKMLILQADSPLCDIALRCGMSDQAHMTRLFGRVEGLSPGAWRRAHVGRRIARREAGAGAGMAQRP